MARFRLRLRNPGGAVAPQVTVAPSIASGTPGNYEVGKVLTATPPTGTPAGVVISPPLWTWENGAPIAGASGTTYTLVTGDISHNIYTTYTLTANSQTINSSAPLVGPVIAAPVSNAPVIADQTIVFGRLTLASAGDCPVVNTGGAITQSCAINSGTNSNHWQISATTGKFTPSATGVAAGLSASYTLGCTFGNADGTDTASITINTEANTYSVATGAQMTSLVANPGGLSAATLAGKTIKLRPVSIQWVSTWFKNQSYSSTLTVTSHEAASSYTFNPSSLTVSGTTNWGTFLCNRGADGLGAINYLEAPDGLRFYRVNFYAEWIYGVYEAKSNGISAGPAINMKGTYGNLVIQECHGYSNWKDLVDTYGFSTLYANMTGGWSSYYNFRGIFGPASPLATTAGKKVRFVDSVWHDTWRVLSLAGVGGVIEVIGNTIFNYGSDTININGAVDNINVAWNQSIAPLTIKPPDINHADAWQFLPNADINGVRVYCNRTFGGRNDQYKTTQAIVTDPQLHFFGNANLSGAQSNIGTRYIDAWVFLNFGVSSALHGISLYNGDHSYACGNLLIQVPSWNQNSSSVPTVCVRKDSVPPVTPSLDVIADNASLNNFYQSTPAPSAATWGIAVNNLDAITPISPANYSTYFDGIAGAFEVDNMADALTAWNPKAGSVLLTSVPKLGPVGTGYMDWATRTWDYPRMNPCDAFTVPDKTGQAASTLITSVGVQITNILKTQTVVDASTGIVTYPTAASVNGAYISVINPDGTTGVTGGVEVRVTTNSDGTGVVTDWTAAGTTSTTLGETGVIIAANKYLWVRLTSGASGTTRSALVRVGSVSDTWSVTAA